MGTDDASKEGTLLGGRYRLGAVLGRGGMGTVYEAVQEDLGRKVAVKVLHGGLADGGAWVRRLQREARAAAALDHPGIVQVTDFQVTPEGVPFLVMERLTGSSLRDVLDREGALAQGRVVAIAVQVLAALAAAHRAGMVHRDVKPDNVFLVASPAARDVVKLLDFGIARAADESTATVESRRGVVLGTEGYMAPEQARGERVDARADVYAVGACLYEALAGRYATDDARTAGGTGAGGGSASRVPLRARRPELDPRLAAVVERALAQDPATRFATAEEMLAALREIAAGPFAGAAPAPAVTSPPPAVGGGGGGGATAPLARPIARLVMGPPGAAPEPKRRPFAPFVIGLVAAVVVGGGAVAVVVRANAGADADADADADASTKADANASTNADADADANAFGASATMQDAGSGSGSGTGAGAGVRRAPKTAPPLASSGRADAAAAAPAPTATGKAYESAECGGWVGPWKLAGGVRVTHQDYSDTGGKPRKAPPEVQAFVDHEVATTITSCFRRCPPLTKEAGTDGLQFMLWKDGHVDSFSELPPSGHARLECITRALRSRRASASCPENACTIALYLASTYE